MALVEDDASAYLDHLAFEKQKYRYGMNGLPKIRDDAANEDDRFRDTCLDSLRESR
jgi:hypothetical protein